MTENVLEVKDLTMHYMTRKGPVYAVDDVNFHVGRGEAIGLVGESGCGKTSIAISLLKLLPENARILNGEIRVNVTDVVPLSNKELNTIRCNQVSTVFQAAMTSMNLPVPAAHLSVTADSDILPLSPILKAVKL